MRSAGRTALNALVCFAAGYFLFWTPAVRRTVDRIHTENSSGLNKTLSSGGSTPEQRRGALLALCQGGRTLAKDRTIYESIEAMSAADLRSLADDFPKLSAQLSSASAALRKDVLEALFDHWLELDHDQALAWIQKSLPELEKILPTGKSSFETEQVLEGVLGPVSRHAPEWLLQVALQQTGQAASQAVYAAMKELSVQKPDVAARKLQEIQDPRQRDQATQGYIKGIATVDPVQAATYAVGITDRSTRTQAYQIAAECAGEHGRMLLEETLSKVEDRSAREHALVRGLMTLSQAHDDEARAYVEELLSKDNTFGPNLGGVGSTLASRDPKQTAEWLAHLSRDAQMRLGNDFENTFVGSWASHDPESALNYALKRTEELGLPASNIQSSLEAGLQWWIRDDPDAAREWINRIPQQDVRDRANTAFTQVALQSRDLESAKRAYLGTIQSDRDGNIAASLSSNLAKDSPEEAMQWATQLPSSVGRDRALANAATAWSLEDPDAVASWVSTLSKGRDRDAGATALAKSLVRADAQTAVAWVNEIGDPPTRWEAAQAVYRTWQTVDPLAARTWLRNLPGIDVEMKNRFFRRER